jgi:hypothetical protein
MILKEKKRENKRDKTKKNEEKLGTVKKWGKRP